ncbi:MAG: PIN domain-containing protein [Chitinophagales bacterium]
MTSSPNIEITNIDLPISKKAAQVRAKYGFKTPDSIQLATAITNNAKFFLTNDSDLKKIKEIEVVTLKNSD